MSPIPAAHQTVLPGHDWAVYLRNRFGAKLQTSVALNRYLRSGVGGPAALFGRVGDVPTLSRLLREAMAVRAETVLLADGLHLLAGDWGFDGLVIRLEEQFCSLRPDVGCYSVGGACSVGRVIEAGLSAFVDVSSLVPFYGQIGSAIMRADVAQRETLDSLIARIEYVDRFGNFGAVGRATQLPNEVFAITRLEMSNIARLDPAAVARIEARRLLLINAMAQRPNPGPIFRIGSGQELAPMMRKAGLAGYRVGAVQVPARHPNTVINLGGASARDMQEMIDLVASRLRGLGGEELLVDLRFVGTF